MPRLVPPPFFTLVGLHHNNEWEAIFGDFDPEACEEEKRYTLQCISPYSDLKIITTAPEQPSIDAAIEELNSKQSHKEQNRPPIKDLEFYKQLVDDKEEQLREYDDMLKQTLEDLQHLYDLWKAVRITEWPGDPYYVLFGKENDTWVVVFGDYDRETVEAEKLEELHSISAYSDLRIITTTDARNDIEGELAKLNGEPTK